MMDGLFYTIQILLVLGFVLFLAHISLRLMGKYTAKQNKIIKIIERVGVNNNSALSIVEICGKYYLMSFTQDDNRILKEIDGSEMKELLSEMKTQEVNLENSFLGGIKSIFKKHKKTDSYWNEGRK